MKSLQRQTARTWQETSPDRLLWRMREKVCLNVRTFKVEGKKNRTKSWQKGWRKKERNKGQGLGWLVCGDQRRASAVSLTSGSLALIWSLDNTLVQQNVHSTPERACENMLSKNWHLFWHQVLENGTPFPLGRIRGPSYSSSCLIKAAKFTAITILCILRHVMLAFSGKTIARDFYDVPRDAEGLVDACRHIVSLSLLLLKADDSN